MGRGITPKLNHREKTLIKNVKDAKRSYRENKN